MQVFCKTIQSNLFTRSVSHDFAITRFVEKKFKFFFTFLIWHEFQKHLLVFYMIFCSVGYQPNGNSTSRLVYFMGCISLKGISLMVSLKVLTPNVLAWNSLQFWKTISLLMILTWIMCNNANDNLNLVLLGIKKYLNKKNNFFKQTLSKINR